MEPTKFEEHSREKFEDRELQPSATAWASLEKMLDADAPAKKKLVFPWFAIAASFIGFIIIASIAFNNSDKIGSPEFVEENTPSELLETPEVLPQENKKLQLEKVQKERIATVREATKSSESHQEMVQQKEAATQYSASEKERVASNATSNKMQAAPNKQQQKSGAVTFQKPKNAIAHHATVKEEVTAANISENKINPNSKKILAARKEVIAATKAAITTDVDALLKEAQLMLKENSDLKTQKVDAMALLGDIELNREQSLRSKVIYALGEGLEYVKSNVVASGN